jgi:histone acetyltransferase (RNA polymerase elongator complex component)
MNLDARPLIIPIFLPHAGCPHRCVFCDQAAITGRRKKSLSVAEFRSCIEAALTCNQPKQKPIQIAFFGGNFLGMAAANITELLAAATEFVDQGLVAGIRFSTRPDTIDHNRLELIKNFPVTTVELGVQSMHDSVLALTKRGHTRAETEKAVYLLKDRNYDIGLQMMVGLPGDNPSMALDTGAQIVNLAPDFVRIYPTIVLAGSVLAEWYRTGKYVPLSLEECVTLVKRLYLLFEQNAIRVIRMGLQASKDLTEGATIVAGPYHPAFGHLVQSEIFFDSAVSAIQTAKLGAERLTIRVHPDRISRMKGLKNANIKKLTQQYHFKSVDVIPDAALAEGKLAVKGIGSDWTVEGIPAQMKISDRKGITGYSVYNSLFRH